jgi:hypothetical protein
MSRVLDLIAVVAVAIVLLLPKPSLEAKPALTGEKIEVDRVAALEDAHFAAPDDVERALALAGAYLDLSHPDWALATLEPFTARRDHRVHLLRATAHAERLEARACVDEAARGVLACDAEGEKCNPADRVRFGVISNSMQALLDLKIDPRKSPLEAREAVSKVLHSTRPQTTTGPTVKLPVAPPQKTPAPAPKAPAPAPKQ